MALTRTCFTWQYGRRRNGSLRDPDNWKKGMPPEVYIESFMRHAHDIWSIFEGCPVDDGVTMEEAICAAMFNLEGYLHELLKAKRKVCISKDDYLDKVGGRVQAK